jgi:hypothetical protein
LLQLPRLARSGARSADCFALAKNCRSSDEHVGSCRNRQRSGVGIDTAVHFHLARPLDPIDHLPDTPDLRQRHRQELLMSESRLTVMTST